MYTILSNILIYLTSNITFLDYRLFYNAFLTLIQKDSFIYLLIFVILRPYTRAY